MDKNGLILTGQYNYILDSKNRFFIPYKLRKNITNFVIAPGIDNCIYVYPSNIWAKIVDKFDNLSLKNKAQERAFKRAFLCNATESKIDKQGRIILPYALKVQIGIKKNIVIIGVGNRLEVWSKEIWNKYYNRARKVVTEIASKLEI